MAPVFVLEERMPQLKSILVKPYFYVEFDEDHKFKIDASRKSIDRFMKDYKTWADKFLDPEKVNDVKACREGLKFLCGNEIGDEIYNLCLTNLREDDPELTDDDCVFQMVPVLTFIAEQWVDHIASMDFERSNRAREYLSKIKRPNAL